MVIKVDSMDEAEAIGNLIARNKELEAEVERLRAERASLDQKVADLSEENKLLMEIQRQYDTLVAHLQDTNVPKVSLKDSDAVMGEIRILRRLYERDGETIGRLREARAEERAKVLYYLDLIGDETFYHWEDVEVADHVREEYRETARVALEGEAAPQDGKDAEI